MIKSQSAWFFLKQEMRRRRKTYHRKARTDVCTDWYNMPTFCGQSNEIKNAEKILWTESVHQEHVRFCKKPNQ